MNNPLNFNSIEDIKKLSIAERILLVEDIWDSIYPASEELTITDEQKKELDARLEAYQKNPEAGKSWVDVRDDIKSRL